MRWKTMQFAGAAASWAGAPLLVAALCTSPARAQPTQKVGAGAVLLAPKSGDKPPPKALFLADSMAGKAVPTSQWFSTLIFNAQPHPIYAQPLSVKTTPAGLELALPSKLVVPTERLDTEIHYPHADALVFAPTAFEPEPAKLAKTSPDTALRDINNLVARGILVRDPAGGRSTSYSLVDSV